jgi:hypothetical protein
MKIKKKKKKKIYIIFTKNSPKKPPKSTKNRHAPIEIKIRANLFLIKLKKIKKNFKIVKNLKSNTITHTST